MRLTRLYEFLFFIFGLPILPLISSCHEEVKSQEELDHCGKLRIDCTLGVDMLSRNDSLFVYDFYDPDNLVRMYSAKDGKYLGGLVKRGNQGSNFTQLNNMELESESNFLLVFDPNLQKVGLYDVKSKKVIQIRKIPIDEGVYNVNKLGKDYLLTGFFPKYKFRLIDGLSNSRKYKFGKYPSKPNKEVPDFIHARANYGKSIIHNGVLVNITYLGGIISFYQINGLDTKLIKVLELSPLNYVQTKESYINTGNVGFVSVTASDKYVYALYSGEKGAKDTNEIKDAGKILYQFDYAGNIKNTYILDAPSYAISFDEKSKLLYSLNYDKNTKNTIVYIYRLSDEKN